jgi:hypothetical protein
MATSASGPTNPSRRPWWLAIEMHFPPFCNGSHNPMTRCAFRCAPHRLPYIAISRNPPVSAQKPLRRLRSAFGIQTASPNYADARNHPPSLPRAGHSCGFRRIQDQCHSTLTTPVRDSLPVNYKFLPHQRRMMCESQIVSTRPEALQSCVNNWTFPRRRSKWVAKFSPSTMSFIVVLTRTPQD